MTAEQVKAYADAYYNSDRSKRNRAAKKIAYEVAQEARRNARRNAGCVA